MAKRNYRIRIDEIHDNIWKITTNDEDVEPFYVNGQDASDACNKARMHIRKLEAEAEEEYQYILTKIVKVELIGELISPREEKEYIL